MLHGEYCYRTCQNKAPLDQDARITQLYQEGSPLKYTPRSKKCGAGSNAFQNKKINMGILSFNYYKYEGAGNDDLHFFFWNNLDNAVIFKMIYLMYLMQCLCNVYVIVQPGGYPNLDFSALVEI